MLPEAIAQPATVRLAMRAIGEQIAVQAFSMESVWGPFGPDRDPLYVLDGIMGDIRNDMKLSPDTALQVLRRALGTAAFAGVECQLQRRGREHLGIFAECVPLHKA